MSNLPSIRCILMRRTLILYYDKTSSSFFFLVLVLVRASRICQENDLGAAFSTLNAFFSCRATNKKKRILMMHCKHVPSVNVNCFGRTIVINFGILFSTQN